MPTAKKPVGAKRSTPASKKKMIQKSAARTTSKSARAKPTVAPAKAMAQARAVEKSAEVSVAGFKFNAVPSGFNKEAITENAVKRFHGSRMLYSWLPAEYVDNNKDRFGYMFPALQGAAGNVLPYTPANRALLEQLGDVMGNKDEGPSDQNLDSGIPAGYTYLGQFVDHDITLDVNSDISQSQDATKIPNMRSPSLDLDAIYGRGPGIDPFLYDHNPAFGAAKGVKLLMGTNRDTGNGGPSLSSGANNFGNPFTIAGGNDFDVPRTADFTAVIGDPRNDENLIVSQLHHAFMKFHNKVVDHLNKPGFAGDLFTEARKLVVHHYQWAVVHDYLKRIADPAVVNKALAGLKFFTGTPLVMPVEFSVAAYRFGHSMVRNNYFVNAPLAGQMGNGHAPMAQVFEFIRTPRLPVFSNWVVDFNLYFNGRTEPTVNGVQFNRARAIDTRLALELEKLPNGGDPFMSMLAKRNLVRGLALRLPSGQAVAKAVNATPLTDVELQTNNTTEENNILNSGSKLLLKKTPLWYYILKEAEVRERGTRLGKVGSVIVAETFVRLLKEDANSFLNASPKFKPSLPRFNGAPVGDYNMADVLNFAGLLTLD